MLPGRYIDYLPDHYVTATKFPLPLRCVLPARFGYNVDMELATRPRVYYPPAVVSFLADVWREFGITTPGGRISRTPPRLLPASGARRR